MIASPFLFGLETDPWLIPLLREKRIWKWLFVFKKRNYFLLLLFIFWPAGWSMIKISILFNSPKALHMLTACKSNSQPRTFFLNSQPIYTTSHWTAVLGHPRDTTNSPLLLLFASCCVSLLTNSTTVHLRTPNESAPPADFLHPSVKLTSKSFSYLLLPSQRYYSFIKISDFYLGLQIMRNDTCLLFGVSCAAKAKRCSLAQNTCLTNVPLISQLRYFILLYRMKEDNILWLSCLT